MKTITRLALVAFLSMALSVSSKAGATLSGADRCLTQLSACLHYCSIGLNLCVFGNGTTVAPGCGTAGSDACLQCYDIYDTGCELTCNMQSFQCYQQL